MKTAKVLACCLLILPLEGPLFRSVPNPRAKSLPHSQESFANQALLPTGLCAGADLFREGHFSGAAATFRKLAARGISNHDPFFAARARSSLGGCLFSLHNVVGSRWTTLDETGALFSALYRSLRAQPGSRPAQALRAAQLEMLRAGDWRARPRYWGAYFVMGVEGIQ